MIVERRPPDDPLLLALVAAQQQEIIALEGDDHIAYPLHDGIEFVLGLLDGAAVATGALQVLSPGIGEVKRMYVRPELRGRGLSRRILAAVEELAAERNLHTLRLETGDYLAPARQLYASSGYVEIPLYGEYVGNPASVCYEKRLSPVDNP